MYFIIIVLLLLLLAVGYFVYKYWYEAIQIWRWLKADKVGISLFAFITDYLKMKVRSKVPPDFIFEAYMAGKKAGISIDIDTLKDFFKIIDIKVDSEIEKFDKSLIDCELRVKRLGSQFILGGSLGEISMIIIDEQKEGKVLKVKGKLQTKSEKDFEVIINNVIAKAYERVKDLPVIPPLKEHADVQKNQVQEKNNKKEKSEFDNALMHFMIELKSDLNEARIYLAGEDSDKELKKHIFKDTYKSLYNSLQSELDIQFRDIESYLNRNINIKVILELLNRLFYFVKLNSFEKYVDLQRLERFILLLGENENILRSLINATKAKVPVDLDKLWDYHLRGGTCSTMIAKRTKAYSEGILVEIEDLTQQLSLGRNVEELIEGLIKLGKENISVSLDELGAFQKALNTIEEFIQNLTRASHVGLNFSYQGLISFHANGGNIIKLMNVLIMAKQADLDVTFDDCMKLNHDKYDFNLLFEALKIKKRVNLDISKESLMNLQSAGGNMHEFAQALEISKQAGLDLKPEDIEADLVEGRKVKDILLAILHARNEGLKLDYNICIKYDRSGLKVPEVVKWAIEPMVININPISIVAKDAIELKLGVNLTVKGRFYLYFNGSRNEVLASRVNEALIKEVERYSDYTSVLESLNHIAGRLLLRLTASMTAQDFPEMEAEDITNQNLKEGKLNSGSAYEIIDVNIPIIDVDNDTLSSIKKEIAELEKELSKTDSEKRRSAAHALELEAKAKLIEAKAELQLGMAEAFRKGIMNTKEYHKMNILDENQPLSYNEESNHNIDE
jgi:uncharacterized protein YqfA (UPF0365 family)